MCRTALGVKVLLALTCSGRVGGCHIHCIHICQGSKLIQPGSISNISYCSWISCNCISWPWGTKLPLTRLFLPIIQISLILRGQLIKDHLKTSFSHLILHIHFECSEEKGNQNGNAHRFHLIHQKDGLRVFYEALIPTAIPFQVSPLIPLQEQCLIRRGQQLHELFPSF